MLILSRNVGQSLRIGDELIVTVKAVFSSVLELSVLQQDKEFNLKCPLSNPVQVIPGVSVVFSSIKNGKLKLGVEAPKELSIDRLPDYRPDKPGDKWSAYLERFKTLDTGRHNYGK